MDKITIMIAPCAECGCEMMLDSARLDDDTTGVIEFVCPNCGQTVLLIAKIQGVD